MMIIIQKEIEERLNEYEHACHRLEQMLEAENIVFGVDGLAELEDYVFTISTIDRFGDYVRSKILHLLVGFSFALRNYKLQCVASDMHKHVVKIVKRWN